MASKGIPKNKNRYKPEKMKNSLYIPHISASYQAQHITGAESCLAMYTLRVRPHKQMSSQITHDSLQLVKSAVKICRINTLQM
ncbi:hypothetical protein GDO78_013973 [Eleutherodactylus coqui]|uniref:Uncharacterized protein n=1 Tax=Eleutherodactylus coqui TaxID=57060 RepID=A0A8J6JXA2_ELECQ|nr:hypothetical protein GDO78_013973 [Eleutherodactylus coqui]